MKRYISGKKRVYGGLSFNEKEEPIFDWYSDDSKKDVVRLTKESSGSFDEDDVRYIYGYQYNPNATEQSKRTFRKFIKNLSPDNDVYYEDDVDDFIAYGVLQIEHYEKFSNFGALVHVEPSKPNSLVDEIGIHIADYISCSYTDFALIKRMCKDVILDIAKIEQTLIDNKYTQINIDKTIRKIQNEFDNLIDKQKLFTMKKFLPRIIRDSFEDFLIFKNDEDRKLYESLQGVDVLIYDDLLTSGATVKEVIRCLKSIHDENRLTVFVLVKQ